MALFRRRRGAITGPPLDVQPVTVAAVPVFAPDARGAALFHAITNQNAANLNSAVRIDARGGGWGGWTQAPQTLRAGLGGAGLGGGRPVVAQGATLDEERSLGSTPVEKAFAQRMAAGRLR
jgi:hypothetical protein